MNSREGHKTRFILTDWGNGGKQYEITSGSPTIVYAWYQQHMVEQDLKYIKDTIDNKWNTCRTWVGEIS